MKSPRIDGHVHFHSVFSLGEFLRSAERNFRFDESSKNATTNLLMLAQTDNEPPFAGIESQLDTVTTDWNITRPDPTSYLFQNDASSLVCIAGRQLVTAERLELLALGTDESFPTQLPLRSAIAQVNESGAVPVIPWGFGKWSFARGRTLRTLLETKPLPTFLVGDSGCRPSDSPHWFGKRAKELGIPNLPGSDPLPLSSHESRAGSFGTTVAGEVDLSNPTKWARKKLRQLNESAPYGKPRSLGHFVADQVLLRLSKRR